MSRWTTSRTQPMTLNRMLPRGASYSGNVFFIIDVIFQSRAHRQSGRVCPSRSQKAMDMFRPFHLVAGCRRCRCRWCCSHQQQEVISHLRPRFHHTLHYTHALFFYFCDHLCFRPPSLLFTIYQPTPDLKDLSHIPPLLPLPLYLLSTLR